MNCVGVNGISYYQVPYKSDTSLSHLTRHTGMKRLNLGTRCGGLRRYHTLYGSNGQSGSFQIPILLLSNTNGPWSLIIWSNAWVILYFLLVRRFLFHFIEQYSHNYNNYIAGIRPQMSGKLEQLPPSLSRPRCFVVVKTIRVAYGIGWIGSQQRNVYIFNL
jgi:hypothetical protein